MKWLLCVAVLVPAVLGLLLALVRTVQEDGLGHRPPPPTRARGGEGPPW